MSFRLAALVAAAALLSACSGPRVPASAVAGSPRAVPAAAAASGPLNAPVSRVGSPGAIALDADQRRALDAAVAKEPPTVRARLRYALAAGEDGKARLVVYDGGGIGADGRHPGKPHDYVVFKVLNSRTGEHYDPQQNNVVAPIPPPVQRDAAIRP